MNERRAGSGKLEKSIEERNEQAYREAVLEYFDELYPEDSPEQREYRPPTSDPESLALERAIEAEFTEVLLAEYGIPKNVIDKISEAEGMDVQAWRLPKPEGFAVPELPKSYAFSGGVARAGLLRILEINSRAGFRDIDIIRFGGDNFKSEEEVVLEREHMPEDSSHGYGVQRYENPKTYLESRDLTISEVYMDEKNLVFTPQCLLDTVRRIVRLSEFEREELKSDWPKTKILAKAVRILAQGIVEHGDYYMDKEITEIINENFIMIFYQALHFLRSMEHSEEAALEYLRILKEHNSVPEVVKTLEDFTAYLAGRLRDGSEFFREAPVMQRMFEDDLLARTSVNLEKSLAENGMESLEHGHALHNKEIDYMTAINEARERLGLERPSLGLAGNNSEEVTPDEYEELFERVKKKYKLR